MGWSMDWSFAFTSTLPAETKPDGVAFRRVCAIAGVIKPEPPPENKSWANPFN